MIEIRAVFVWHKNSEDPSKGDSIKQDFNRLINTKYQSMKHHN